MNPRRLLLASCFGPLLVVNTAQAQQTGEEVLSDCEQTLQGMIVDSSGVKLRRSLEGYRCLGYLRAVQGLVTFTDDGVHSVLHACPPSDGTLTQLVRIVVNHGRAHPEQLHKDAATFAVNALRAAFPCLKE